eukprot:8131063-Lingulodinium_polyedra.AAC.1
MHVLGRAGQGVREGLQDKERGAGTHQVHAWLQEVVLCAVPVQPVPIVWDAAQVEALDKQTR